MPGTQTAGVVRKFITRTLAAGTLLAIYAVGTVVTTGAMLTADDDCGREAQWRVSRLSRATAGIAGIAVVAGAAVWCAATATIEPAGLLLSV